MQNVYKVDHRDSNDDRPPEPALWFVVLLLLSLLPFAFSFSALVLALPKESAKEKQVLKLFKKCVENGLAYLLVPTMVLLT